MDWAISGRSRHTIDGNVGKQAAIPETMFTGREQPHLSALQHWVLENSVTEIEMNERRSRNYESGQKAFAPTIEVVCWSGKIWNRASSRIYPPH